MMGEAPRRRVVTLSLTPAPGPSQPRVRAKVDPSTIATPPVSRPALRSTPSSSSSISRISVSRPYSPIPSSTRDSGSSTPGRLPRRTSSPVPVVIRAKATPLQRSAASSNSTTPTPSTNSVPCLSTRTPPIPHNERPKVRTNNSTGLPPRSKSPARDAETPALLRSTSSIPDLTYSPDKHLSPLPPHLFNHMTGYAQHPTASCPPSPPTELRPSLPAPSTPTLPHSSAPRNLPIHPSVLVSDLYANIPSSPELRTIGLPALTPRRGSEISDGEPMSRGDSFDVSGIGIRLGPMTGEPDSMEDARRWSGAAAAVSNGSLEVEQVEGQGEDDGERAEEAKVNRKIADLEISNASLMAINRTLEATKTKQRAEIIKLRRALRESTDAPLLTFGSRSPPLQPVVTDEDDMYASDELENPEIEERWEKIQDLVSTMQKRADTAVKKAQEEVKVGQRVLAWSEMDGEGDESVDLTPATGTPDG